MMLKYSHYRFGVVVLLLLMLLSYVRPEISAHGGGTPQFVNADIGPYWISTWMRPSPPTTDEFHLTVALTEPTDPTAALREAGPPILNATIQIQLQLVSDTTIRVSGIASHENATNKFLYEADLNLPQAGTWQGEIIVEGPDGGQGTILFETTSINAAPINIAWIILAGVVIFALALWLLRRSVSQEASRT
ncbi:MAG: hypothetical protein AAF629_17710 [Chloroflexota bacterium]